MFFSANNPPSSRSPAYQDDATSPADGRAQEQEVEQEDASAFDPEALAEPSASQVTMVEVTLLGDLVRILDETKTQQRLRLEEERAAKEAKI